MTDSLVNEEITTLLNSLRRMMNDENYYSYCEWYSAIFNIWAMLVTRGVYISFRISKGNEQIYCNRMIRGEPDITKIANIIYIYIYICRRNES